MLIGVVGKPSVGKSTFFKAATLAEAEIANYPFTTIKPNHAIGYVRVVDPAKQFGKSSNPREGYVHGDTRFVPLEMLDVAGLVPGAHKGLGRGNQFLDDLNQADALIHVIDVSGSVNEKGEQCEAGSYDPANDIKFLEEELDHWFLRLLKKGWDQLARKSQQTKKETHKTIAEHMTGLRVKEDLALKVIEDLHLVKINITEWTEENLMQIASTLRRITKPMIIACNKVDVPGAKEKFEALKEQFPDYHLIPCSAESELALKEAAKHELIEYLPGSDNFELKQEDRLNDNQKKALQFIKDNILTTFKATGVQEVLDYAAFELLNLIAIFPGGASKLEDQNGNVIPDCFLMPKDTTALGFAYRLHTDFGDKFIRAIDVKTKMTVGKDHKLKHGDILEIVADK
ncbi:MAG: redox-regulated ATPase YchF [Nanoarchaeota archaeon]|nr:redox-regulated ATPase YchF [Nanoarchaeota archaeon]